MSDGTGGQDAAQSEEHARVCNALINEVAKVVVGQETMIARLIVGLLSGAMPSPPGLIALRREIETRAPATDGPRLLAPDIAPDVASFARLRRGERLMSLDVDTCRRRNKDNAGLR